MTDALPRLLWVDDEPNILSAIRRALRNRFDIAVAADALSALSTLDAHGPFDAVITDLSMPGLDGLELLHRVRTKWPETARILFSGHGAGCGDGRFDVVHRRIAKPVPTQELGGAIQQALDALREEQGPAGRANASNSPQRESTKDFSTAADVSLNQDGL